MNEITTVAVDLAKDVLVVVGGDASGREVLVKQFNFQAFGRWAAQVPACVFGMEAGSSAHFWARRLASYGHTVKLMAPEFVKPFRKSQGAKNDRNDARAILIAVRQPDMRFVTPKTVEQQATLAWHRLRKGLIYERTALTNRMRSVLAEFGIWLRKSPEAFKRALPEIFEDDTLPMHLRQLLLGARDHWAEIDAQIEACDLEIRNHAARDEGAKRLSAIVGVGPLTASAAVATIADARQFRNGRQMAAWLGLVPRQSSSGGKDRLGRITRRGDAYLRGLLTGGARATLLTAQRKAPDKRTRHEQWIMDIAGRMAYHKALVAIANKHARMMWAMLAKSEAYDPEAWQRYTPATKAV
jgi:transposase